MRQSVKIKAMIILVLFTIFILLYGSASIFFEFEFFSVERFLILGTAYLLSILIGINAFPLLMTSKNQSLDSLRKLADMTKSGVYITDEDARVIYANKAFLKITGYSMYEIYGVNPRIFKSGMHDDDFYKTMYASLFENGYWEGEIWDKKKSGAVYPKHAQITRMVDPAFKTTYYIAVQEDMTGHNAKKYTAYNQGTFLPNENSLKQLLAKDFLNRGSAFVLYYIRILNRTSLESAFGCSNYEKLLNAYAKRVNVFLRDTAFLSEISRDTLVVVSPIPEASAKNEVIHLLRQGRDLTHEDIHAYFNINIGVATYPDNGKTANELLRGARLALDHIMYTPGIAYEFYNNTLKDGIIKELTISNHFQSALDMEEFEIHYQPQYDGSTKHIVGIEALLRWHSEDLGDVSPETFIKVAEESGYIGDITQKVFELLQKDMPEIYKANPDLKLAINISSSQLKDDQCLSGFSTLHELIGIPPSQLELEITEGAIINDVEGTAEKLKNFKATGIRIAIDDFGTGFSTMAHLGKIPADMLKIDKSFVMNYPEQDDGNIASLIIKTAETLNMEVLGEGVETSEQRDFLLENNCTLMQGYYFSKPLPKSTLIKLLKNDSKSKE